MFVADVEVEDQNEIAQDSCCMLAHGQGTFSRVVDFRVDHTTPVVSLCRVPLKTTKTTLHIIWYQPYACFLLHELDKLPQLILVPARAATSSI